MRIPLLALVIRSFREDSRSWWTHILRTGLVAVALWALWMTQQESWNMSTAGLIFFQFVVIINFVFITLVGVSVFATVITEEKEQQSLGLLKLTGLSPLSILLGKSLSQLLSATLLLAVQLPFTLLAIALGGISSMQIFAAYILLAAYTFFVYGVALLCSVLFQRSATAVWATGMILMAFLIAPVIALEIIQELFGNSELGVTTTFIQWGLQAMYNASPFIAIWEIMATGFTEPIVVFASVFESVAALVMMAISWMLFGRMTRNEAPASVGRGWYILRAKGGKRSSGRAWPMAIVWKEFRFLGGGLLGLCFSFLIILAIAAGWVLLISVFEGFRVSYDDAFIVAFVTALCIGAFQGLWVASGIFADEHKWKTLSSLAMLPTGLGVSAYQKAFGACSKLIPALAVIAISLLFDPGKTVELMDDFFSHSFGFFVLCTFFFGLHASAYISLWVRRGALAITVAGWVGTLILLIMVFGLGGGMSERQFFGLFGFLQFCAAWVFHPLIAARLRKLAAE